MRFDVFCPPTTQTHIFSPDDVHGRGLGGAELSLIGLTEELARQGHSVAVWNIHDDIKDYNGVTYRPADEFDPLSECDVFVLYRNCYSGIPFVNAKHKIFWSCDQQTDGDFGRDIFPFIDHTIAISEYHRLYHIHNYRVEPGKITAIDLGVRLPEYATPLPKIPNSLLYCSIPARGLQYLADIFPAIHHFLPDTTLTITSDYRLWGPLVPPNNEQYLEMFDGMPGVNFLGKVARAQLVQLQLQSDILAYPNCPDGRFAELFCVSAAEAQVSGCVPITSQYGAFPTTVLPEGILLGGHPSEAEYRMAFIDSVLCLLTNRKDLEKRQNALRAKARQRFDWNRIAHLWVDLIQSLPAR